MKEAKGPGTIVELMAQFPDHAYRIDSELPRRRRTG